MATDGQQIINSAYGWMPLKSKHYDVKVMSVGSLLEKTDNAIIWRGPRKTGLIKQFLKDTFWSRLDFLIFGKSQACAMNRKTKCNIIIMKKIP